MNHEGYADPTADKAVGRAIRDRSDEVSNTVKIIKALCALMGFEIVGRFTLRDKKTGVTYK